MHVETLIDRHPQVFHTADARAWDSIQTHGLLPTSMLRDLVGADFTGARRRSTVYTVPGSNHTVVIRDQQPLKFLDRVLHEDTTEQEFLDILDGRCFFWATEDRLMRIVNGRNYRKTPQVVLSVDTASLVSAYGDIIELSPYNSGDVHLPGLPRRGRSTFKRIADYDYNYWVKFRGRSADPVVEVTVPGPIPNILDHVSQVRMFPDDFDV
jgi:hypothetical protein